MQASSEEEDCHRGSFNGIHNHLGKLQITDTLLSHVAQYL